MTIPVYPETSVALKGKKGLIVGIANDQSIAWGCAKASRALGAELAATCLDGPRNMSSRSGANSKPACTRSRPQGGFRRPDQRPIYAKCLSFSVCL